jgi:preprotein translocase subunit YajC
MLQALRKNDRVLTSGGLFGTVLSIRGDEVTLKIDETANVRARFTLSSVAQVFRDETDSAAAEPSSTEKAGSEKG